MYGYIVYNYCWWSEHFGVIVLDGRRRRRKRKKQHRRQHTRATAVCCCFPNTPSEFNSKGYQTKKEVLFGSL
jgi:predicted alpha-1,6-mannanase (GH76 family)